MTKTKCPTSKKETVMCLKILQSFKALEITDWTSALHSCRTILVLSCEPLTLWVTDLVVCIFIVCLCIHAPTVSYHLNWLACHYFLCGRLIVAPKSFSLSGKVFIQTDRDNKLLFSDGCSKIMCSRGIQNLRCSSKKSGQRRWIFHLKHGFFLPVPAKKRLDEASRGDLSSWSLAIRRALSPHALEAH